jgi:hypothetical protein
METEMAAGKARHYALFTREPGQKRWTRISRYAYWKVSAISIFQSRLLDGTFSGKQMSLRPTDVLCDESIPTKLTKEA